MGRIRLNSKGHNIDWLVEHFKRSRSTVEDDLNRFEQHGIERLADGQAPGQPAKITTEIAVFLERNPLEDRTWNCSQLAQEIQTEFSAEIKRDTIRVKLLELGYSWKRGRYSPGKTLDPTVVAKHKEELKELLLDPTVAPEGVMKFLCKCHPEERKEEQDDTNHRQKTHRPTSRGPHHA